MAKRRGKYSKGRSQAMAILFQVQSVFFPGAIANSAAKMYQQASEWMARDIRKKIEVSIMGGRDPSNPFKRDVVGRNGLYLKTSIARPFPGAPRSYTKPKDPIALSQVAYAEDKTLGSELTVGGRRVKWTGYVIGPIGGNRPGKPVPKILEAGGTTTRRYYLIAATRGKKKVKTGALRWKFIPTSGPAFAEGVMGPKTFQVRGRGFVERASKQIIKRTGSYLKRAISVFPWTMRREVRLPRKKRMAA